VVTVLFLAPLTRTSSSNAINALWQLDGARVAQRAVNATRKVYVRLVVANSAENFTSGPSVVQAINRAFPSDPANTWSIKAVIGVAQSRSSAREALSQFRNVQIVASSVNGTDMRHGLIQDQDPDFGNRFVSVSPSDVQVATAMVAPDVLRRAQSLLANPESQGRPQIIRDPDDTYFSNDLANDLVGDLANGSSTGLTITPPSNPQDLREVATDADYRALAKNMCSADNAQAIWLFSGRGNQLAGLDQKMPAGCQPVVIAGPGAISAVAASDSPGTQLQHMRNLLFYSLVSHPSTASSADTAGVVGTAGVSSTAGAGSQAIGWADGVARASDRATGYAALVEAVRRIPPTGSRGCPQADPDVTQIGMNIPTDVNSDGHNTLGSNSLTCGVRSGSPIYLCPFQSTPGQACTAATGTTPTPTPTPAPTPTPTPPTVKAAANRGSNDPGTLHWYDEPTLLSSGRSTLRPEGLPWDSTMQVLCAAPGENARDGWVGVYSTDHGWGFVHWKVRFQQQNYYLRFTVPGVKNFDPKTMRISHYLPRCSNSGQLQGPKPTT
jgi:hypothetical protein